MRKPTNTKPTEQLSLHVSQEQLLAFVRAMIGEGAGRDDDQQPLPPGPWDPVIRVALEQIRFFGPSPERRIAGSERSHSRTAEPVVNPLSDPRNVVFQSIFRKHPEIFDAIGGGHSFGDEVALNPQPLPPRAAFLIAAAQAVIRRAELLQEIADATSHDGSQQGIIIVGGYTSRFSDDWCGTGFKLRWPFPGPRPHWFPNKLNAIDLIVVATQFEQAAKETFSHELRQHLAKTSAKFTEVGMSRLQSLMDKPGRAAR
jgi:hypothetical protein